MTEESYEMKTAPDVTQGTSAEGTGPIVGGIGTRRPSAAKLEPLLIPEQPCADHDQYAAPSLVAARLFKPVTVGFKNLSYSVRNGIFRKGLHAASLCGWPLAKH
ncbi:abc transporter [Anopheles sinensis]|uniref:Abc transporter n=1 Tax=Anopheles sinensis TaxID=74873 RepID=A0A084VPQ3_ANOSI|nr:abc transporter [Anopheles sinensis]